MFKDKQILEMLEEINKKLGNILTLMKSNKIKGDKK